MANNKNNTQCEGCGQPLVEEENTIVIQAGVWKRNGFEKEGTWAVLHRPCFNRSILSPDATLEELRRITGE